MAKDEGETFELNFGHMAKVGGTAFGKRQRKCFLGIFCIKFLTPGKRGGAAFGKRQKNAFFFAFLN